VPDILYRSGTQRKRQIESGLANQTVQRTGASRFAQGQIKRQRRLAPVADLANLGISRP
jgi:hypothetical protein